jgi:hypothetical protein
MNSAELDLIASLVYMTDRRTMLYARRENSYPASPVTNRDWCSTNIE